MSNHTPGPWKRSERSWGGKTYWVVENQTGTVICQAEIEFNAYDDDAWINIEEENTANVKLVARAPNLLATQAKLLAACVRARDTLADDRTAVPEACAFLDAAIKESQREILNTAIAEAEGETT